MGPTIVLPPLSERAAEVPRIIEEFGHDYSSTLGGALRSESLEWVMRHESSTLARIATATRRLVALNRANGNVSEAASLLGMSKSSLGEWFATRPKGYR
jgi:transcriptional regulator with AAA-type ATPase domain